MLEALWFRKANLRAEQGCEPTLLKIQCALELPGDFVEMQILLRRLEVGPGIPYF